VIPDILENKGGFGKNASLIWIVLKIRLSFLIRIPIPKLESVNPLSKPSVVPDRKEKSAKPKKANLKP
jgi:hypothetical protein